MNEVRHNEFWNETRRLKDRERVLTKSCFLLRIR